MADATIDVPLTRAELHAIESRLVPWHVASHVEANNTDATPDERLRARNAERCAWAIIVKLRGALRLLRPHPGTPAEKP